MLVTKFLILLASFFLLSAAGFGPALVLTSSTYKRRILMSAALAPVLGIIVIAFFLYILFLIGVPIRQSALPITIGGLILSAVLAIWDWRSRPKDYSHMLVGLPRFRLLSIAAAWVLIIFILFLPAITGGPEYQFHQGNIGDATNYVSMAIFDRDFPASYVLNGARFDEIIDRNPTMLSMAALGLGNIRPSAPQLLAWQSVLFSQSPIALYYFGKLLSFVITAALAAALAYQLGFKWWLQIAFMFVSAVGFWAVFVSDIDALSQIYAIPLCLLVIFAFIQFEREGQNRLFSRHRWFLALTVAALFCFYAEITLPLIPVFMLYYGLSFLFNPSYAALKNIALHGLTAIMVLLFLNIMLSPILTFAQSQSQFALVGKNTRDWASMYFAWLFFDRNPFFSLWGLRNLTSESNGAISPEIIKALLLITLFIVIGAIVGNGVLKSLTIRLARLETRLLAVLITVYWGGGLVLYLIANDWVAGKMLAMGAPFVVLGIFVFFKEYFSIPTLLNKLLQVGLVVWVVVQTLTLPLRAWAITGGIVVPDTVPLTQLALPQVILPITERIKQENITKLGLDLGDPSRPVVYLFALALSDVAPTTFNSDIPFHYYLTPNAKGWTKTDSPPGHLVVIDSRDYLKPLGLGQPLITVPATSLMEGIKYVSVYAVKPKEYDLALYRSDILIPDVPSAPIFTGFDAAFIPDTGNLFIRWMVDDSSELHFMSATAHDVGLYMESSAAYNGSMALDFNDAHVGEFQMKKSEQMQSNAVCLTTKTGSNVLKFTHENPASTDKNRVLVNKILFAPVDTLDIGAVVDTRQIETGWEGQENWGEETIRWATQNTRFQIMTCGQSNERTLHFRAFLPEEAESQNVTVTINGTEVSTIEMSAGWNEYSLMVDKGLIPTVGLQTIELHHSSTFIPASDTRSLSAAYDRFWFTDN